MAEKILFFIYVGVVPLILSLVLNPLCSRLAKKYNILAHPHAARLHGEPMPLLGGVAIVASIYGFVLVNYIILMCFPEITALLSSEMRSLCVGVRNMLPQFFVILVGGILIFFLGLLDDLKALGPKRKFLFEAFVGVILYFSHVRITLFLGDSVWSLGFTVLWVVGITNAFNLLDNMDGLAAGSAIIASFVLFILCIDGGQFLVSALLIIFIGALLGFLRYNYPPARMFMGDAGSLFIGYFMSVLTIMSTFYTSEQISLVPFVSPLLILAVPIYDTVSVVLIRLINKKSIFKGDKNHFSHRLLRAGMSQREAVVFIYLVGLYLGMAAMTLSNADLRNQIILLVQSGGLLSLIYVLERVKRNS